MRVTATHMGCLVVVGLALVAGCRGSTSDKAGGQGAQKPLVLTMATWDAGELERFVKEVGRLSGGTIRIEVRNGWRHGQVKYENGLIGDVRARKADLGVAGSRAWDSVGVNDFRALHAPLLIDNYALEEKVVRSALVERMLQDLKPLGLVGLGVLPGPMRKPVGVNPLVKPADYSGLTIGVQQSRVADATMRILGANPVWLAVGGSIKGFDGMEVQIGAVEGNRYDAIGKHLTTNVSLWPRPLVLFANRKAFIELSPDERRVLRRAVANVVPDALSALRGAEREATGNLCRRRLTFETASVGDLAALRKAVQPVYDDLERDPGTRHAIAEIERLKRESPSPPEALPACRGGVSKAAGSATPIDGVWRMTTKFGDAPDDPDPTPLAENYGTYTFVFARGRFAFTQEYKDACTWGYGTYLVKGHQAEWSFKDGGGITPNSAYNKPGEHFVFSWSLYRGQLTLSGSPAANFRLKPWRRISTTPARSYFSKRCPPPATARVG